VRDLLTQLAPHLEAEVAAFVREAGVPGAAAAAVVRHEPTWAFAFGIADAGTGARLTAAMPMRVGSLTKPFTAAAVLALRDAGALSLDDPVTAHLAEFAAVRPVEGGSIDEVLVRHLVTHRAGLPGEVRALDEAGDVYPTIEEILEGLAEVRLRSEPGATMRYSNLGYQLLGEIVARRAGSTYERYCGDALLERLALRGTAYRRPPDAARGHRARAFTDHVHPVADRRKRTNADGGLWSTAPDQAGWIRANLDAEPPLPFLPEMHAVIPGSDANGSPGQGMGWFRERRATRTLLYHQGSTPGFASRAAFSPSLGAGAVVLANGEASTTELVGRIVDLVLDGVDGARPSEPAPPVPEPPHAVVHPVAWDELLGFYVWPGSSMLFRLEVRSGVLRLVDVDANRPAVLIPDGDDRFVAADGAWAGEHVTIRRDRDGAVHGLRVGPWSVARLVEASS
jgi:CubicO group peptidase (beta-lactamase class C family)